MTAVRLWSAGALVVLAGCTVPSLEEIQGRRTVNVKVDFDFSAGCIVVAYEDVANPENVLTERFRVTDASGRQVEDEKDLRQLKGWDWTVKITTTAMEQSCEGRVVASRVSEVTLDRPGTQTVLVALIAVDVDGDGFVPVAGNGTDCDDNNAAVSMRNFYADADGDGVGGSTFQQACTAPDGYVASTGDCDDNDATRWPGNSETCDEKDNDCNNQTDEGLSGSTYFPDEDRDGVGSVAGARSSCRPLSGYVTLPGDCDDRDSARRPGNPEVCDDKDNDCDSQPDDGLATTTYFRDADGDTYGLSTDSRVSCSPSLAGYVTRAGDCNDAASAVNPGVTETCNDIDDNCAGGVDEGFNKGWYRDADRDGFGDQSTRVNGCQQPAGYVGPTATFDCNDSTNAVRPGATELCNEVDDNCVGGVDEPFTTGPTAKGNACSTPCPGGTYICRPDGTGTTCAAPPPTDYYPDIDGDGAGDENATAQSVCPSQPVPANTAPNRNDCDDRDRHNWRNNTEVCDDRDNNCVDGGDEGNVCNGAAWGPVTDPAVALSNKNWNTVAVNPGSADGYPVWIAGEGGVLARRGTATGTFTGFDGQCGTTTWNAAWVRPSDGRVYLGGNAGRLAEFNGTTCTTFTTPSASSVTGIVGFETGTPPLRTVLLYVVDMTGRLHSWRPEAAAPNNVPQELENAATIYRDVHGFDASRLFLTGQESGGTQSPIIRSYTGSADTIPQSIASFGNSRSIRSVWVGASSFAYAVGDASIVVRWNGVSWVTVTPPGTVNFTSVCSPDPSSGYTTDSVGVIRRYTGSGWVPHHDAGGELRDIALSSPGNVWAVGPSGRVVHFPVR